jgi:hypothetical protein
MPKYHSDILELARRGAEHRYQELKAQLDSLLKHFPHLGMASTSRPARPVETRTRRRRRKMSAAQRKAISERMKKTWAARRKAKA